MGPSLASSDCAPAVVPGAGAVGAAPGHLQGSLTQLCTLGTEAEVPAVLSPCVLWQQGPTLGLRQGNNLHQCATVSGWQSSALS